MPRLLITQGPRILKEASLNWWQNKAPRRGASLAFYSVLSLAPLVILLTPIVALFFKDQAPTAIIGSVSESSPDSSVNRGAFARSALAWSTDPEASLIATTLGIDSSFANVSGLVLVAVRPGTL